MEEKLNKIRIQNTYYDIDGVMPVSIDDIDSMHDSSDQGVYKVLYGDNSVGTLFISNIVPKIENGVSYVVQTYIGPYKLEYTQPNIGYRGSFQNDAAGLDNHLNIQTRHYITNIEQWSVWKYNAGGADGKSAYQTWLETDGLTAQDKTEHGFLVWLQDRADNYQGPLYADAVSGVTQEGKVYYVPGPGSDKYTVMIFYGGEAHVLATRSGMLSNYTSAYDISAANENTPYLTLRQALAAITDDSVKKGGMTIKFIQGTGDDAKYVQYMYLLSSTAEEDFTNISNWINDEEGEDTLLNIKKGSYNNAWIYSQANNNKNFMWLLYDTVDGTTIQKPIFHVGNGKFIDCVGAEVQLVEVAPSIPVASINSGTQVTRNTPLEISFAAGSILHYSIGGTAYIATTTPHIVNITEDVTIDAYAVNSIGSSDHAIYQYTIKPAVVPTFSLEEGTVVYNSVVTISFPSGSTLYYKINDASNWSTSQEPVSITIDGTMTIQAKVYDGVEESEILSKTYTVAAPADPVFSIDAQSAKIPVDFGETLEINFADGYLEYAKDNDSPSNATVSPIRIPLKGATGDEITISATVRNAGGASSTISKIYKINQKAMKISVNAETVLTLGGYDSNDIATTSDIPLSSGETTVVLSDYTKDDKITSIGFKVNGTTNNTTLTSFNGGGAIFDGDSLSFEGASNLISYKGLVIKGNSNDKKSLSSFSFKNCSKLTTIDLSDLAYVKMGTAASIEQQFFNCMALVTLDISNIEYPYYNNYSRQVFACNSQSALTTLIIGNFRPYTLNAFSAWVNKIKVVICTQITPPTIYGTGNYSWLKLLMDNNSSAQIYVPNESVESYQAKEGWSAYNSRIHSINELP